MKRRSLTILLGAGAVLVVAASLVLIEEVVVRVRLAKLERDPGRLGDLLREPDGFGVLPALERHVATAGGRRALLRLCLARGLPGSSVGEQIETWLVGLGPHGARTMFLVTDRVVSFAFETARGPVLTWRMEVDGTRALAGLPLILPLVAGEPIELEDYPGVTFTVLDEKTARARLEGMDAVDGDVSRDSWILVEAEGNR